MEIAIGLVLVLIGVIWFFRIATSGIGLAVRIALATATVLVGLNLAGVSLSNIGPFGA